VGNRQYRSKQRDNREQGAVGSVGDSAARARLHLVVFPRTEDWKGLIASHHMGPVLQRDTASDYRGVVMCGSRFSTGYGKRLSRLA
jgi:hypothetical protein